MSALRLTRYSKGIQLWCAPTVDEREIWQSSMGHIAYEGRCFVLSACPYLSALIVQMIILAFKATRQKPN